MKRIVLLAALCVSLSGCSSACVDEQGARTLLEAQGYTAVRITGWDMFGCGKDDHYASAFTAKSPNGTPVKGVVCAGLFFKGATVRFK
ncbi:MAG: Citrobacter phage [Verrucomicrobiota bacterium]|jgi:hypothetical protein